MIDTTNPSVVITAPRTVVIGTRAGWERREPKAAEIQVQTEHSLISTGTELTLIMGEEPTDNIWSEWFNYPSKGTGYSSVGTVIALGPEADPSWLGRRVACYGPHRMFNLTNPTRLRPIDSDAVSNEEATFFILAETVMNGVRRGHVTWGESVAVFGAGILGQLAVRFCRLAGARPVFAIDIADSRLERLPDDGQIIRLNPTRDDIAAKIKQGTRGRMVDVGIELTGNAGLIASEIRHVRPQGRFVLLSSPRGSGAPFNFHDLCNYPSYSIIGAQWDSHPQHELLDAPWTTDRHSQLYFDLLASHEIEMRKTITHRIPYYEAPSAYELLMRDRSAALSVILDWTVPPGPDPIPVLGDAPQAVAG